MTSGATALNPLFGGFTTTSNPQYGSRKIDLCGYSTQIILLSLKWVYFQKFALEANNLDKNIIIIVR